MNRLPVRLRVTVAFALAMALVLGFTGWFLYARLGAHLANALDRELSVRGQDLVALVVEQRRPLAADQSANLVERGETYAELLDPSGRVVDSTPPLGSTSLLTADELHRALRAHLFTDRARVPGLDEPSRLLATPVRRGGRTFVLVVGLTKQDREDTLGGLRDELLLAGPIALVLASIAGYALAGVSLRQVDSMRRRAAAISADTRGERLPVPASRDELSRLALTLNDMLDRLESALDRERDFVADAGHELRTPLALLRTELELALRQADTTEQLRAAVAGASAEADRLSRLAEDLLLIARADRGLLPLRLETVDVDELFDSVVSRFSWHAEAARLSIRANDVDQPLYGDRLRLEQALANLVDNALRYAQGNVELSACVASGADGRVELHVVDDGPGFPPEFLPRAFERFTRADAARGRGGTGLGLAIVTTIATAHGGVATARNRDGEGGADVWLALPVGGLSGPPTAAPGTMVSAGTPTEVAHR
jgi:two-component system, OmpR family, sensor kinase